MSAPPSAAGPGAADWEVLGLAPTGDAEAVRRAYRARLKTGGPERDPEGFQRLREAYEAVLAALGPARPDPAPGPWADPGATARAVIAELDAHRAAGDEAGAIAVLDAALAARPPGSPALDALEDALLDEVALARALSPGLFRHLVTRLDWRDAQGRAARTDPERHAVLLDRVAAEDWMDALRQEASGPEGRVAAALLLPFWQAKGMLPSGGLDTAGRGRVRELFEALRLHGRFLLQRFDGATLALLREAVEGPPLLGASPALSAAPSAFRMPDPAVTRRRGYLIAAVLSVLIVGGVFGKPYLKTLFFPPDPGTTAEVGRAELENPATAWLTLSPEPGGTLVDWAPLTTRRRAIADVRYGVNTEEPNAVMPLQENGTPIQFLAPPSLNLVTLRLRFRDGTWSEVRRYPINGGPPTGSAPAPAPGSPSGSVTVGGGKKR